MCHLPAARFRACGHSLRGDLVTCAKYNAECDRRSLFKKVIGWKPEPCLPKLRLTEDPNLCPRCQKKKLSEQFSKSRLPARDELIGAHVALNAGTDLWQDDEERARIQKGNIAWDLDSSRGTTDFGRRDQRGRPHAEPAEVQPPKEKKTGPKKGSNTGGLTRQPRVTPHRDIAGLRHHGHGDKQPPRDESTAVLAPKVLSGSPQSHMRGSQDYRWSPPTTSPPSKPLPPTPSTTDDRSFSKALPPHPLKIKGGAADPAREFPVRYGGQAQGKTPVHSLSRSSRPGGRRQDSDSSSRISPTAPAKPSARRSPTRGATYEPRNGPSRSQSVNQPPQLRRTPAGGRFLERLVHSDEDVERPRREVEAAASSGRRAYSAPSGRGGPPTSFDDVRLGRYVGSEEAAAKGSRKSAKKWLKRVRPTSPVETDVSFACRDARDIESRR